MKMTYRLTAIRFPSGRYGFAGSIPTELGYEMPATKNDVMGCRTHRNINNESVVWEFPSFPSVEDAIAYAKQHGFTCHEVSK